MPESLASGKAYVLPPSIFLRQGGFALGETMTFRDHFGKEHLLEVGPVQKSADGHTNVYLNVDHHERVYVFEPVKPAGAAKLSKEEIAELAKAGDFRAPFAANVSAVSVKLGQEVAAGDQLVVLEAMKMQIPIVAEAAGVVAAVSVKVGDKIVKIDLKKG